MATFRNTINDPNLLTALGTALGSIADGDIIEITKYSTRFTAGTDLSSKDLLRFELTSGFDGEFSAEVNGGLVLECDRTNTGSFINRSSARRIDLAAASNTDEIYTITHAGSGALWLATLASNAVYQTNGVLHAAGSVAVVTYDLGGNARAFLRKITTGTAPTTITVRPGASATIECDATTLNVTGGEAIVQDTSFTPTTANLNAGLLAIRESGTIPTLNAYAGVLDFSDLAFPVTITDSTFGPNLRIRYRKGGVRPVFTNATTYLSGALPVIEEV